MAAAKNPAGTAYKEAAKAALVWVKTVHADRWAQMLGDEREKVGLPREPSGSGRHAVHGTFKAWVRHIEKGETPCRLCAEAFEAKTSPLIRRHAVGGRADPVELPKSPTDGEVLQCEDCDYAVDASSVTRRQAMAMHVRKRHNRALLDSESKPVRVAA